MGNPKSGIKKQNIYTKIAISGQAAEDGKLMVGYPNTLYIQAEKKTDLRYWAE